MEYSQQSATLIFTASTVLMVISLMLLNSTWGALKKLQHSLPVEQRKIYSLLRLHKIQDKVEHNRQVMKNLLWTGSLFLGLNIFLTCVSIICIAGLMTNLGFGPYGPDNFNGARYMLFVSPIVLFAAILCIGGYRFYEFLDMKAGKLYSVRFQTEETINASNEDVEEGEGEEEAPIVSGQKDLNSENNSSKSI